MRYCKKCVMPDTRPGITFDEEGVCSACQAYEKRSLIDWNKRWKDFEEICNKYRGMNGPAGYESHLIFCGRQFSDDGSRAA